MKESILIETALEYYNVAERLYKEEKYNSALVLYFKSLVSFIDLMILKNKNITPSSHNSRFNIAKKDFPEIYRILDKDFPFYQNSYTQKMTKEITEVIKEDAEYLAEKAEVKIK